MSIAQSKGVVTFSVVAAASDEGQRIGGWVRGDGDGGGGGGGDSIEHYWWCR